MTEKSLVRKETELIVSPSLCADRANVVQVPGRLKTRGLVQYRYIPRKKKRLLTSQGNIRLLCGEPRLQSEMARAALLTHFKWFDMPRMDVRTISVELIQISTKLYKDYRGQCVYYYL